MPRKTLYIAAAIAAAALLIFGLASTRTVTMIIDGQAQTITTRGWTVSAAARAAGVDLDPADYVDPSAGSLLIGQDTITVERAHPVKILTSTGGDPVTIETLAETPGEWLEEAQITLAAGDRLYLNGVRITDPGAPAPLLPHYTLQVARAFKVTLTTGEESQTIRSAAHTVGEALWEAGVKITAADRLSVPLTEPLDGDMAVDLVRARPVQIEANGEVYEVHTTAQTVGEALADAGLPLQGLDYSQPHDNQPLPEEGAIRVVRVREEVLLAQEPIPYQRETTQDPEVELDTSEVTQAGEFGIEVAQVRVRYEDGVEVNRTEEARWVAKEPKNEVVGYGTKVVVKTLDTPEGTIEYWRAVTVYVTSYSPCRSGVSQCLSGTSLGLPVQKGVIGVTRAWYSQFAGQKLYVPGYGTGVVADVGGGVPGEYWIDLGYSDHDYVPWHHYVTVYFLTPVPANVPWILP